jgi:hypothetical protein
MVNAEYATLVAKSLGLDLVTFRERLKERISLAASSTLDGIGRLRGGHFLRGFEIASIGTV